MCVCVCVYTCTCISTYCRSRHETSERVRAQSCPTLRDPVDYSLLGSSVHGILQARVLEWVAMPFSGRSSQLRD